MHRNELSVPDKIAQDILPRFSQRESSLSLAARAGRAVTRAAHVGYREGCKSASLSVGSVARRLGGTVAEPMVLKVEGTPVPRSISPEEREKYGFGELPDNLIHHVKYSLLYLGGDNAPTDIMLKLAARTMQEISARPAIELNDLWDDLSTEPEQLPTYEHDMSSESWAILIGVVADVHAIASDYFNAAQETLDGDAKTLRGNNGTSN